MITAWLSYSLGLAALIISFVGGTRVGRLQQQEQDRAARRRRSALSGLSCRTCGARAGEPCIPTRHRVPSRSPRIVPDPDLIDNAEGNRRLLRQDRKAAEREAGR
jgi:hypothetical protein